VQNRELVLSAIHALFKHWELCDRPKGVTPFASFPEWAEVVGGVMGCAGLGDPCLPHKDDSHGNDPKTEAMRALFQVAHEEAPDGQWMNKREIFALITAQQDEGDDRFYWFGNVSNAECRDDRTKTGMALKSFKGRELSSIRLIIDDSDKNSARHRIRFEKVN
jgi:hypothetical protein